MTPEEVESRLQSLQTPVPPERLRERCLAPQPRAARPRAVFAVAASFLVVALTVWLATTGRTPSRAPDNVLVDPSPPALPPVTDDVVLQDKIDRLLKKNPGKAVLAVRVQELRDGVFRPVTQGMSLKILLEDATRASDPLQDPDGPNAKVDLDGHLLYLVKPGKYHGAGFSNLVDGELLELCFVWEYKDLTLKAGEAIQLSDAIFSPWMQWSGPEAGSTVGIKGDPKVSWTRYPGLRQIQIGIERVTTTPDGHVNWSELGSLKRDAPQDAALPLSELLRACRLPARAGDKIALNLTGFGDHGRELTRVKEKLQFLLKE